MRLAPAFGGLRRPALPEGVKPVAGSATKLLDRSGSSKQKRFLTAPLL
eukprot:CAMPEP_0203874732 /NCGR_PEP_ID=MMETSP0359-20131031/20436_1 /ASSEMBLY_ACC=CAM_ASM_000338 /TAXON_ID=268821 /ORGANISM="Scrippsiella Hangoei, Strain SHTV-5" /LENGTH=47 /DNA_ID= /DNA_START= /DNA_END= /DNA_ORIENTATION=